jgi:hypothetical protein
VRVKMRGGGIQPARAGAGGGASNAQGGIQPARVWADECFPQTALRQPAYASLGLSASPATQVVPCRAHPALAVLRAASSLKRGRRRQNRHQPAQAGVTRGAKAPVRRGSCALRPPAGGDTGAIKVFRAALGPGGSRAQSARPATPRPSVLGPGAPNSRRAPLGPRSSHRHSLAIILPSLAFFQRCNPLCCAQPHSSPLTHVERPPTAVTVTFCDFPQHTRLSGERWSRRPARPGPWASGEGRARAGRGQGRPDPSSVRQGPAQRSYERLAMQ